MKPEIRTQEFKTHSEKISIINPDNNEEIGRVRIFMITNDLRLNPYALIEDVYVNENYRKQGYMNKLINQAVQTAKDYYCYRIVLNCHKPELQEVYERKGFKKHGLEHRMELLTN